MNNIVFDPKTGKGNRYIDIIAGGLNAKGYAVYTLKEIFAQPKLFFSVRIVHVNWFDNLDTPWDFVKRITKLLALKIAGKSIVWTLHNRLPHGGKKVQRLQKMLTYLLIKSTKTIVVHCKDSEEIVRSYSPESVRKIKFVPHPNYIGEYGNIVGTNPPQAANPTLNLLFVGAVKPYKNIELLIDVIRNFPVAEVSLTIAGKPASATYGNALRERIQDLPNVSLLAQFIEDEKLISHLAESDLVVLPYDIKSSLNSGTVLLAFSYGKSVICPRIGTIAETRSQDSLLSYEYTDKQSHYKELTEKIAAAIRLKKADPETFRRWGAIQFNNVSADNDKKLVVETFHGIYAKLT